MNNAMLQIYMPPVDMSRMPRGYEQDPMTAAQREHSRRTIADANFRPYGSAIASGIDKAAGVAAGFMMPILNGDLHQSARDYQIGERNANAMLPRQTFDAAGGVMMGSSFAQAPKNALRAGMAASPDLDMSQAARLQRAREMGFDTDQVWYHGTKSDFKSFKRGWFGVDGPGVYLTRDPDQAGAYAGGGKGAGIFRSGFEPTEPMRNYEDGSIIPVYVRKGMLESDEYGVVARVKKPFNIRSVNATFDPAQSNSSNLMAANPFTGAVVPTFTAPEE